MQMYLIFFFLLLYELVKNFYPKKSFLISFNRTSVIYIVYKKFSIIVSSLLKYLKSLLEKKIITNFER